MVEQSRAQWYSNRKAKQLSDNNGTVWNSRMDSSLFDTTTLKNYVQRIRAGDESVRNDLLERVHDRLERLCRKMLGRFPSVKRFEETCDVLQNSLLRLVRSLEQVNPTTTREFFGLAAEQIRRELLDLARYYKAERRGGQHQPITISMNKGDEFGTPAVDPPAADTDEDQELERWCNFHEQVERLPPREREIVGLLFYHSWTQQEVADLFGVNEKTVRRWWISACEQLQELLKDDLPNLEKSRKP